MQRENKFGKKFMNFAVGCEFYDIVEAHWRAIGYECRSDYIRDLISADLAKGRTLEQLQKESLETAIKLGLIKGDL